MTRSIDIDPLARVEGYGRISVHLSGRRVERVELALDDSPRLFEALLVGKHYRELPEIACRICSICSTVHRLTALMAIEAATATPVSPQAQRLRLLALEGGHIASHALHLAVLILPDLLGVDGLPSLAAAAPELLQDGLAVKGAGNALQETIGGRAIHPVTLVPGGIARIPGPDTLLQLREQLQAVGAAAKRLVAATATPPPGLPALRTLKPLAVSNGDHPLVGTQLRLADGTSVPLAAYSHHLAEQSRSHTAAKLVTVDNTPATVGAAARLVQSGELPLQSSIAVNPAAQGVELLQSLARGERLLTELLELDSPAEPLGTPQRQEGFGCAACEAPRGTLLHAYHLGADGTCHAADIITPTAINQAAMVRDLEQAAHLIGGNDEAALRRTLAVIARCYDPCISCSVHLVRL